MNVRDRWVSAAAGAALLAATVLAGSSLFGALRVESAPPPPAPSLLPAPAAEDLGVEDPGPTDAGASERERRLAESSDRIVTYDAIQEAVENDLFQPERQALSERYRLPSDFVVESPPEREPGQGPDFRVVGSAVLTGNSFALLQSDDDPPYAVRVGETFRGYRVTTVDAEWVMVTGSAGQVTIPVQAAVVASGNGNGNGGRDQRSRNQDQNQNGNQNDERATRQRLEEAQRAIQQLRQLGAAGGLAGLRLQAPGGAASFQVGPDGQIQVVPSPQGQIIIGPGGQPRVVPQEAAPQARRRGGGGGGGE